MKGLPVALMATGGDRHDVSQLAALLDGTLVGPTPAAPPGACPRLRLRHVPGGGHRLPEAGARLLEQAVAALAARDAMISAAESAELFGPPRRVRSASPGDTAAASDRHSG